jgi:hypothetical protein
LLSGNSEKILDGYELGTEASTIDLGLDKIIGTLLASIVKLKSR